MEKFTVLRGVAAPLMMANVDTGAMADSRWTKNVKNTDDILGEKLFACWRFELDGSTEKPDFILNQPLYRHSRILLAGENFGCGSSREAAVWALMKFGIKCVIAPSFGDIFFENCFQNGLLPIVLAQAQIEAIAARLKDGAISETTVDLEACQVTLPDGAIIPFTVNSERRTALLEGLDELDQLLSYGEALARFQSADQAARPWLYDR
jgi:3-isopropylmalate/(R)-2-methylmalate dehydratase small subunit